jgi:hypothetical protein
VVNFLEANARPISDIRQSQVVKEVGQQAAEEMAATLRIDELVLTDAQLSQVRNEGMARRPGQGHPPAICLSTGLLEPQL